MMQTHFDEQRQRIQMIRDSATAIVPNNDFNRIRQLRYSALGMDMETWQQMGQLGWLGIRLPEAEAGSGFGMEEYVALLEELGSGLVPEPLIDAVLVASLLPHDLRQGLLAGTELILPVGFYHNKDTLSLHSGKLNGCANHVYLAQAGAEYLVFTESGLALVARTDATVTVEYTQDGGHMGTLTFSDVVPKQVFNVDPQVIAQGLDEATLGAAAYLLGIMRMAFDQTLNYLLVREQFGRVIGSFQVLQHRLVDLKIQLELCEAIVHQAANYLDKHEAAPLCQKMVSTAKLRAASAAFAITRQSIQLHGGIGYTDECDIGLFLRKTLVFMERFGTNTFHHQRYINLTY